MDNINLEEAYVQYLLENYGNIKAAVDDILKMIKYSRK